MPLALARQVAVTAASFEFCRSYRSLQYGSLQPYNDTPPIHVAILQAVARASSDPYIIIVKKSNDVSFGLGYTSHARTIGTNTTSKKYSNCTRITE